MRSASSSRRAQPAPLGSVCATQGRRHHHQVRKLRPDLGKKKHEGGRQDESERYRDDVNAVVDWISHCLGLSTSSKWVVGRPRLLGPSSAGRSRHRLRLTTFEIW